VCFALRFMAIRHGWHLPAARLTWRRTTAPDADTPDSQHNDERH
jgi:hypothetical protein